MIKLFLKVCGKTIGFRGLERMVTIVVGGHFGDEGKGKIVSYLAMKDNPYITARSGIGPNAGHTVYMDGKKYGLRMIPCGFVNQNSRLLIGAGVLVDTQRFLMEVDMTSTKGRIGIDKRCAIIEEKHKIQDKSDGYLSKTVGTTGSGCGPANAERTFRTAKLAQDIVELKDYITDVPLEVNGAIGKGKKVLIEASQGFGLSLFYGTYPYVTSKDTSASMAATDIGIGPTKVKDVIVVYKAYTTRVGGGPLDTEINENNIKKFPLWPKILEQANKSGIKKDTVNETLAEFLVETGTVTGRLRRIGNFDFNLAKYSSMVNGATQICITCLDKLFPENMHVQNYNDLSSQSVNFIKNIEKQIGVRVTLISTGPEIDDVIDIRK